MPPISEGLPVGEQEFLVPANHLGGEFVTSTERNVPEDLQFES